MPPTKPHLHLHRDEPPVQGDSIPFPGMNQRGWTPRLAGEGSFPDAPVDAIAMSVEDANDRLPKGQNLTCREEVQER